MGNQGSRSLGEGLEAERCLAFVVLVKTAQFESMECREGKGQLTSPSNQG